MATDDQWDPEVYERFKAERDRPAHDLYAPLGPTPGGRAVDLGCGPGHLTAALAERLDAAEVVGIDSSPAMLARAAAHADDRTRFELGDLASWGDPRHPVDVIAASASLHWVPDHPTVLARWTAALRPGGQLAVQVPANADHPSHLVAAEVANEVAYRVLTQEPALTVTTCNSLKIAMDEAMDVAIKGSKVNQCGASMFNQTVPEVIWPPPGN